MAMANAMSSFMRMDSAPIRHRGPVDRPVARDDAGNGFGQFAVGRRRSSVT